MKTLLTICTICGLLNAAFAQTEIPPPWTDIQLTGVEAKVLIIPPPRAKGIPLWIPITGGVITGGTLYWLLREEDAGPEPMAIIRDDAATVPCGIPGTFFDPLLNDTGAASILSVAPVSGATIEIQSDGQLLITADGTVPVIETTLRIRTENGEVEESLLIIQVAFPPLEAVDDTAETAFETPWVGNVLDNDTATDGMLSAVDPPENGTVSFTADGQIFYTPVAGFSGTDTFTYTLAGRCTQTTTATVRIEVQPDPACAFTVDTATQTAYCGNPNGSAEVTLTPEGNYVITWPDGVAGPRRDDLAPGLYAVTVTPSGSNCPQTVELLIEDAAPNFTAVAEGSPAQCGVADGVATATVTGTGEYSYTWSDGSTGPTVEGLAAGTYSVTVAEAATGCTVTATVVLTTIPLSLELLEETTPSGPTAADGQVTLALTGGGSPPFRLLLNGVIVQDFIGEVVTVEGLTWGTYQFQVESAEGCLSNVVGVTFAQLGRSWTVGAALGSPGGASATAGTVEHPVPESAPSGAFRPGLRLIHWGRYRRAVWQFWPGMAGGVVISFIPQWRGRWGRLAWATGPGIWWRSGSGLASEPVDWRWTGSLDIALPQYRAGRIGVELSYGPVGRQVGLVVDW